jgi:small-conductance mechanosensitive channel
MQPTDPLQQFIWGLLQWWGASWPWVLPFIYVVVIWIALAIASHLLTRFLRKRTRKSGVPASAINGFALVMNLVFVVVGVFALFALAPPLAAYTVQILGGASLLIGTALGFGVGWALRNMVSGVYVMMTHPFAVGDYIRIGDSEGMVQEISLNYTKVLKTDGSSMLFPNNRILESSVTNFRIEKKELQQEEATEPDTARRRILHHLIDAIDVDEIVRYVFELEFSREIEVLVKAFDKVCARWAKTFGFQPAYWLSGVSYLTLTYSFAIYVENPRKILDHKADFMEDIVRSIRKV